MRNVLIVDDDAMMRFIVSKFLELGGFAVKNVLNGRLAFDYMSNHPIDLVITDIEMPEMNGHEVIEKLQNEYPNVKIIAMSGCGYTYDESLGDDHEGYPPGMSFADLPDDFVCPACAVRYKEDFVPGGRNE